MLSSAPVAATLAVNDLEAARRFYEERLGFEVEAQVAETVRYRCGRGTGLAIFERPMTPVDRTVAAFEVGDIEGEVAHSDHCSRRGGVVRPRSESRERTWFWVQLRRPALAGIIGAIRAWTAL